MFIKKIKGLSTNERAMMPIFSILIISSCINIFNYVKVNSISLTNYILFIILCSVSYGIFYFRHKIKNLKLSWYGVFSLFILWTIITTILHGSLLIKSSLQNLFIYLSFFLILIFTLLLRLQFNEKIIYKQLNFIFYVILLITFTIMMISMFTYGFQWNDMAALAQIKTLYVDPRSFGAFMLFPLAWFIASWMVTLNIKYLYFSILCFYIIYFSLSRGAYIVSIILLIFATAIIGIKKIKQEQILLLFLSIIITFYTGGKMNDRLVENISVVNTSGLLIQKSSFNGITSGRTSLWVEIIDGIKISPWMGYGLGKVEVLERKEGGFKALHMQPHNEYLRLIYDFGLLGFSLLAGQFLLWVIILKNQYQKNMRQENKILSANALILLAGLSGVAMIDNLLVYSYIMFPLAILISFGMGSKRALLNQ